ncbi:hypothetical protein CHELA1G11_12173 [Hyphomicrobiales bacterium]|nr:hypothetical protein CHELA1G2_12139 [Hyphomicrobiales bacterium]CAH1662989.1 hypothetical protein CHELA1G11_12173 [Hyphomicrobiales bacterium]
MSHKPTNGGLRLNRRRRLIHGTYPPILISLDENIRETNQLRLICQVLPGESEATLIRNACS